MSRHRTCENESHDQSDLPEAVALITLVALCGLDQYRGYAVCAEHLCDYVRDVYLDCRNDLRRAFTVTPA